jgi:hypothetical protein
MIPFIGVRISTHVGQKFRFGTVGLLRRFLGRTQFRHREAQCLRLLTLDPGCPDLPRNVVIDAKRPLLDTVYHQRNSMQIQIEYSAVSTPPLHNSVKCFAG